MRDFELAKRQILDRVDLLTVVSEHVRLKRQGRRWVGLCPFHTEKTPSFTVNPDMGIFKCFGCGKGGDLFSFIEARENIPFGEAMRVLADRAGIELNFKGDKRKDGVNRTTIARANDWALRYFRRLLQDESRGAEARRYAGERGFDAEAIERFEIGLATGGDTALYEAARRAGISDDVLIGADLIRRSEGGRVYDTFRERLMFPIRDAMGRAIGFGGRTLAGDKAKYLNTRQTALFDKGRGLYGVHLARGRITEIGRAVVVEGYTDCLAAHQSGITETVATLGTALTEAQVELLRRYGDEVIFLFDSDDAGEAAADRAIHVAFPRCMKVRLARISDGKDPSDFLAQHGPDAFKALLNGAIDALEFKWLKVVARFGGDESPAARREAVLDFLRVVASSLATDAVDAVQRGLLVNQVAHLLRMDRGEVDHLLTRLNRGAGTTHSRTGDERAATEPESRGGTESAWQRLLEVALNEPGLLSEIDDRSVVDLLTTERDRRIADVLFELYDRLGEFHLSDVLVCLRVDGDTARVTELAERGAARGNYVATFRHALACLQRDPGDGESVVRVKELLADRGTGLEGAPEAASANDRLVNHKHFAPRRWLRRVAVVTDESAPSESSASVSAVESK